MSALADLPRRKRTDYLVVHVTATRPSQDIGREEIDAMHRQRGFAGIGYNRLIKRDGTVEIGRGDDIVGAHVEGFNSIAWGISLVGGIDEDGKPANNMTSAQEKALEAELLAASKRYPNAKICGHRDLSKDRDGDGVVEPSEWMKACPCFDAIPWAKSRGLPAANIRGAWDQAAPAKPEGPDTREVYLQRLLGRAGYKFGAIDGIIGNKTIQAIKQFQLAKGLTVTGLFDTPTIGKLEGR